MKPKLQRPRQVVSDDVAASLMGLIQVKFYQGNAVQFAKDNFNLLHWVVFYPAKEWFNPKDLFLPNARYLELVTGIIMDAAAFQRGEIRYVPAYLKLTIQNHFKHHWDEIYDEAKAIRSQAENALAGLGKLMVKPADDVVSKFAAADRLLVASKVVARVPRKPPQKEQLNLL